MALASAIQWEVRPATGTADNGGGFKAGASGQDYSQQTGAQVVIDNSTIVCTTPGANSNTLTFASGYTPTANDVGNVVAITGGTNINANLYEITGYTSTTWTLAGSTNLTTAGGAGSAITGRMGGARTGLSTGTTTVQSKAVGGNKIWIKTEAWNEAVTFSVLPSGATATNPVIVEGYNSTRGDAPTGDSRPTNDRAGAAGSLLTLSNPTAFLVFRHFVFRGAASAGVALNSLGATPFVATFINCRSTNNGGAGFTSTNGGFQYIGCEADGNGSHGFNVPNSYLFGCTAHHNTNYGYNSTGNTDLFFCLDVRNGGGISIGFTYVPGRIHNMTVDANDGAGFSGSGIDIFHQIMNSQFTNNGTYGLNCAAPVLPDRVDYNNVYGNGTSDYTGGITAGAHDLSVDPEYADASRLSLTDLAIDASDATKVTSAAHPFASGDVGRYIKITAGTGFTQGGYWIRSIAGSAAVLDHICGITGSTGGSAYKDGMDYSIGTSTAGKGWPGVLPG